MGLKEGVKFALKIRERGGGREGVKFALKIREREVGGKRG